MRRYGLRAALVALGVAASSGLVAGCHEHRGYYVEEDYPVVAGYPDDEVIIEGDRHRHWHEFGEHRHHEGFHHERFRHEGRHHEERHEEHHEEHHDEHHHH